MKVKLELDKKIMDKVVAITKTDYLEKDGSITVDGVESMLEDMISYYESLKEEYEDYQERVKENYTQNTNNYGMHDSDF